MLTRLRYVSTLAPKTTDADIDAIVALSSSRNRACSITGILAVEGVRVLQVLEGPSDHVGHLFDRIVDDFRHFGVVELERVEIVRLRYPNWGMIRRPMSTMMMAKEDLS